MRAGHGTLPDALTLDIDELVGMRRTGGSPFADWKNPDSERPGDLRSRRRGIGFELESIGPYQPGDDVRHIDWLATARTGRPHVRHFEAELQYTLVLVIDLRGSMYFGSTERLMAKTACLAGAALMWRLSPAAHQPIGLVCLCDDGPQIYRAQRGTSAQLRQLQRLADAYQIQRDRPFDAARRQTGLEAALHGVADALPRTSQTILISDFSDPGEQLAVRLAEFARGHLHSVVVHDPLGIQPPPAGRYPVRRPNGPGALTVRVGDHDGSPDSEYARRAMQAQTQLRLFLREQTGGQVLTCDPVSCDISPYVRMGGEALGQAGRAP